MSAAMEDLRILWMRDRVYAALGLQEEDLFRDLLQRDDAQAQRELLDYLDQPSESQQAALLFNVREVLVEVEEDEPECKYLGL